MEPTTTKSEYARALDLLTRYLAIRDHSRFELHTKLSRRFPEEVVEQALQQAQNAGYLKDEDALAADLALIFERRGKSQTYIEAELQKRHLPIPARDDEKELATLRSLIERKFGAPQDLKLEEKAKAYRFLCNRGFEDRMIRMVIDGWDQD